jgi:hypothetical protein
VVGHADISFFDKPITVTELRRQPVFQRAYSMIRVSRIIVILILPG